jgi:hypothetical protein
VSNFSAPPRSWYLNLGRARRIARFVAHQLARDALRRSARSGVLLLDIAHHAAQHVSRHLQNVVLRRGPIGSVEPRDSHVAVHVAMANHLPIVRRRTRKRKEQGRRSHVSSAFQRNTRFRC